MQNAEMQKTGKFGGIKSPAPDLTSSRGSHNNYCSKNTVKLALDSASEQ